MSLKFDLSSSKQFKVRYILVQSNASHNYNFFFVSDPHFPLWRTRKKIKGKQKNYVGNKNIETHGKRKGDLLKSRRKDFHQSKNAFFYTSGGNLFFLALFDFIYLSMLNPSSYFKFLNSSQQQKYFVNLMLNFIEFGHI